MVSISSTELQALVLGLIWPLTRILGLMAAAPLFANRSIPARAKLGLAILLTAVIAPVIPPVEAIDPFSFGGLLVLVQQFFIGVAMGFAMRIVFAAVEFAGEVIGLTMGLGFATLFDPQSQGRSSAIAQFLGLLVIMLFLALNVHLMMLQILAESFITLPIGGTSIGGDGFYRLAEWGSKIFSAGLQLALPIIAALLITNMALGILTRAAPQLNLFAIGFPLTLAVGFILLLLSLPYLATPVERLFMDGLDVVRSLGSRSGASPMPLPRPARF